MAEGKKTFIFYSDWINMVKEMPDTDAGQLLKHILGYVNDENPQTDNVLVKMAFGHMKPLIKDDLIKWEKRLNQYSEMGKKSADKRAKDKLNPTYVEPTLTKDEPTPTVNVNVNVNENDNVNVNDSVTVLKDLKGKKIKEKQQKEKSFSPEVENCFTECLKFFPEHLHPKKPDTWKITIKQLNEIEKLPFETIIDIVKRTRADDFWSKNFLSLTKLRKKNKDDIPYVVVFNERIDRGRDYGQYFKETFNSEAAKAFTWGK